MTPERLRAYRALAFDCDGVLLDSNKVKTQGFHAVARRFGDDAADQLVEYHVTNGGISRYRKFEYLLRSILDREPEAGLLDELLASYAAEVRAGLMGCAVTEGLRELRDATASARWLVVSGGDQNELREVFAERGLADLFDGGIFGSPDSKDVILAREIAQGNLKLPALFLGDSRYDFEAASRNGLDFLFVSGWTEFSGWHALQDQHGFEHVARVADIAR